MKEDMISRGEGVGWASLAAVDPPDILLNSSLSLSLCPGQGGQAEQVKRRLVLLALASEALFGPRAQEVDRKEGNTNGHGHE